MNPFPIFLSLKLCFFNIIILLSIALPLSYFLAFYKNRISYFLQSLLYLPLFLPPTVIGFYLLLVLSPNNFFGSFLLQNFGLRIVFTFPGILIASLVFSFPYMVQPTVIGFKKIPIEIIEASYTLGRNKFFTFFKIILPESKVSILTGCIFSTAHTLGEFGVTYMIGGSIPDETKTVSIAIYEAVEAGRYLDAHKYSMLIFLVSIFLIYILLKTNENQ